MWIRDTTTPPNNLHELQNFLAEIYLETTRGTIIQAASLPMATTNKKEKSECNRRIICVPVRDLDLMAEAIKSKTTDKRTFHYNTFVHDCTPRTCRSGQKLLGGMVKEKHSQFSKRIRIQFFNTGDEMGNLCEWSPWQFFKSPCVMSRDVTTDLDLKAAHATMAV